MRWLTLVLTLLAAPAFSQTPCTSDGSCPGIPAPSFGLTESTDDVSSDYWVDNDDGGCSDAGNGTSGTPRCTLPAGPFAAGEVVQIRGGTSTLYIAKNWTFNGTAGSPVIVKGPISGTKPKITFTGISNPRHRIAGSYVILEWLEWNGVRLFMGDASGDHQVVRHSRVTNVPASATGASVLFQAGQFLVVWNTEIDQQNLGGNEKHGIHCGGNGSGNSWILNNHIHHNLNGDAIQCGHGSTTGPQNLYIGGNEMNDDLENAMDFKGVDGPLIISGNTLYNYFDTATSNGEAIRINDEWLPREVWILNNEIYNSVGAINPSQTDADTIVIAGNYIHDVDYGVSCCQKTGTGNGIFVRFDVVGNTFYNITGQAINRGASGRGTTLVQNNIIWQAGTHITGDEGTCSHNLTFEDPGTPTISVDCTNTQSDVDPDISTTTARLASASSAVDNGTVSTIYADYLAQYGLSIASDYLPMDGGADARPQDGVWDIGADEWVGVAPVLQVDTTSFPGGMEGVGYSQCATASNGTPPYTWTTTPITGSFPTGLTFSTGGCFSGTPSVAGTFNFTLRVTDNNSDTDDSGALSINIAAASPPSSVIGKFCIGAVCWPMN